jgi:hypothetical protein
MVELTTGLADLLRGARQRPADPRFQVSLSSGDSAGTASGVASGGVLVRPNDPLTVKVKLTTNRQ